MNALIRLLYALLIAVAVVVFATVSIHSLYPGPKSPEYPQHSYSSATSGDVETRKQEQKQKEFDNSYEIFREKEKNYQRNVSMIAVVSALLIVAGGLWYMRRNEIIGEGLAIGGVAVSIYGVITASMADHRIMRLVAVTTLLVSALVLVHRRFIEKPVAKKRR